MKTRVKKIYLYNSHKVAALRGNLSGWDSASSKAVGEFIEQKRLVPPKTHWL